MRSLTLALLGAIVVLFTTVPGASAQSDIDLGAGTSGVVQFLATGAGNFDLNMCSLAVNGACVGNQVQGPGNGDGFLAGNPGFYQITGGGITGTLTSPLNCAVCQWTLSGSVGFNFSSMPNGGGTDLLDGTFTLVSMTQKQNVNGVGFNQMVQVNFAATGGTLLKYFDPTGKGFITLDLKFTTDKNVQSIPGGSTRFGLVVDGTVTPTPEPGTMALLGSGVLLVGGFLRKRFGA